MRGLGGTSLGERLREVVEETKDVRGARVAAVELGERSIWW